MSNSEEIKVLLAGDVLGSFSALFRRVEAVSQKVGRFDCLICVGDFFGEKGEENIQPYLDGKSKIEIPTYFTLGLPFGRNILKNADKDGSLCSNLTYLHPFGLKELHGLQVAFLSGRFDPLSFPDTSALAAGAAAEAGEYRACDVQDLLGAVSRGLPAGAVLDLLITAEWGKGVLRGLPSPPAQMPVEVGSPGVAELVQELQPRYHVAGTSEVFLARDPYKNKRGHVTRFIGLGAVGNPSKQKWLHALALAPASCMPAPMLFSVPPGSTPSPFSLPPTDLPPARKRPMSHDDELGLPSQPWRWQDPKAARGPPLKQGPPLAGDPELRVFVRNLNYRVSEPELTEFMEQCGPVEGSRLQIGEDGRPRGSAHVQFSTEEGARGALLLSGEVLQGREVQVLPQIAPSSSTSGPKLQAPNLSGESVYKCWFCLSNPEAAADLVGSIGEQVYLSLEKSPIAPHHVQLVPIAHLPNTVTLPEPTALEFHKYLDALKRCFSEKLDKDILVYERYMALRGRGGNHCFVAALPVSREEGRRAGETFHEHAKKAGVEFEVLPVCPTYESRRHMVQQRVGHSEYLLVILPDGGALLQMMGKGQNLNFAREVIASLVGKPERQDWKACCMSKEDEQSSFEKFKSIFSSYDIMN